MTDLWIPNVRQAQVQPRVIDKAGRFTSPISGNVRTVKRSGLRWGFVVTYASLTALERARLEPLLVWLGGAENRFLYSPGDHVQRGSFPSKEMFLNNRFENGVNSWSVGPDYQLSAVDGTLQARRVGSSVATLAMYQTVSVTPYAPLVLRTMMVEGRGTHSLIGPAFNNEAATVSTPGYRQLSFTPHTSSVMAGIIDNGFNGATAGDYVSIPYMSLARCPLVDNGVNLITNSDVPGGSGWSVSAAAVGNNGTQAPDGSLTAQYLTENSATSAHYVSTALTVPAGPRDFTFAIYVHANNRSFVWLQLQELTGNSSCSIFFNLSTGAVGTITNAANWSDTRGSIQNCGNGWWRVGLTSRLTNAATSIVAYCGSAPADNTVSYTGGSIVSLLTWRANFSASSTPARAVQTAGAAIPGNNQSGSGMWIKGLPVNTDGLLLQGDYFEINRELKKTTASLNSDSFGCGYLQFSPALRFAPLDNDPIILQHPVGSFIANGQENGWTANPGIFSDISLDLVEAY